MASKEFGMQKKIVLLFFLFFSFGICAKTQAIDTTRIHALPKTVALTFDDGPSPIYTPQVLAILKKYNIKATFFVVGVNAKKYPEIIKEIHAEGHVVASHSLTHPMLTKLSNAELQKEVALPSA